MSRIKLELQQKWMCLDFSQMLLLNWQKGALTRKMHEQISAGQSTSVIEINVSQNFLF